MPYSYTSQSFTFVSYTVEPLLVEPPTIQTEFGGLLAVYKNSEQVLALDCQIQKRGERGLDSATVKFPYGAILQENDKIEIVIDKVNLKGLVGIYHFENHSKDESGKGHHMQTFVTAYGSGKFGSGLVFNGSSAYGLVPHHSDFNFNGAFEISFYLKCTGTSTNIIQKRTSATDGWAFQISATGKLFFKFFNDSITSTTSVNDGVFRWIRIIRNSDGLITLYINNTSEGTPFTNAQVITNGADVFIGKNFDNTGYLNGTLDIIRIYKGIPLTTSEATRLYNVKSLTRTMKFGGRVWHISDDIHPITIQAKSYGKELGEIQIKATSQNVFSNVTPEYIVQTLIINNTSLQFIDLSAVSATQVIITRFVAEGSLIDLVGALVSSVGKTFTTDGLGHFFLMDVGASQTDLFYEHGKNGVTIRNTTQDDLALINDLTLIGALTKYTTQQSFSGDSSNKIFTLADQPLSTKVTVGTSVKRAEIDYKVDVESKTITFTVAPTTGTNNVIVDYVYEAPVIVRGQRKKSVDKVGRRDAKLTLPWIREYVDGLRFTQNYLALMSDVKPVYTMKVSGLAPELDENKVVRAANQITNLDASFAIKEIIYDYRAGKTTAYLGQFKHDQFELHKQTTEKLHQLESIVTTTKTIRDYKPVEETLAINVIAIARIAPDEAPHETLTITDTANGYQMTGGYGNADYNAYSAYGL